MVVTRPAIRGEYVAHFSDIESVARVYCRDTAKCYARFDSSATVSLQRREVSPWETF